VRGFLLGSCSGCAWDDGSAGGCRLRRVFVFGGAERVPLDEELDEERESVAMATRFEDNIGSLGPAV
jgi:hypothetical protein